MCSYKNIELKNINELNIEEAVDGIYAKLYNLQFRSRDNMILNQELVDIE